MEGKDYIGGDFKLYVTMEAPGFDMMTDEWEVQIKVGNKVCQTITKAEAFVDDQDNWYVAVDGSTLREGKLDVVCHAKVPDDDFADGIRDEIDKHKNLTTIEKP